MAEINTEELDKRMMEAALRQAHEALEAGEVPIGAVVVCGERIVASGRNMTEGLNDPTAHAEMIALTAACDAVGGKYLNDCTLYVTVEPCPMCAAAMAWAQLGRLVYGASDPKRGYSIYATTGEDGTPAGRSLLHPKTKVRSGVLEQTCSSLMKDFFAGRR